MEEIACIFCNIWNAQVLIEENGYLGRKCANCGLIYISPRPRAEAVVQLYENDNAQISAQDHISLERRSRLYARHHLGILGKLAPTGSLLEIGAGAGYFLAEARKRGYEPFAIEFNAAQAEFMRATLEIPCEQAPLGPASFGGKAFDVIYHSDVMSHFYDPVGEFRRMHAALRPGGWLIFETGNGGDVDPKYLEHVSVFQYPDHLFFFSLANVRALLELSGFDLVELHSYSVLPQLRTLETIERAKKLLPRRSPATAGAVAGAPAPAAGRARERLGDVSDYANYLLRYKVGSAVPKGGRPQTFVVVARAREHEDVPRE
jgi:SAM-dependent methyltransferase